MSLQDSDIVGRVRSALAHERHIAAPAINITFLGDTLSLVGVLNSQDEVTRAEQVARGAAPGVVIDNGLTVAQTPHGKPSP